MLYVVIFVQLIGNAFLIDATEEKTTTLTSGKKPSNRVLNILLIIAGAGLVLGACAAVFGDKDRIKKNLKALFYRPKKEDVAAPTVLIGAYVVK